LAAHGTDPAQPLPPMDMSMLPTLQDGDEESEHEHPHEAGPPVGAVMTVELVP